MTVASGKMESKAIQNGYGKWSNVTVPNSSWLTNTGLATGGLSPGGTSQVGNYNLTLNIPGTYLVVLHANYTITNTTGLRGMRIYLAEQNIGEYFFGAGANGTDMTVCKIITVSESQGIRMGLYQSSGASATAADIEISAILLKKA